MSGNMPALYEWQTTPGVALTITQVTALRTAVPDLRITPSVAEPHVFDLTPGSTVGTVVTEDLRVDIYPKVRPQSLLYMMSAPMDERVWTTTMAGMGDAEHLVEAFVPSFLTATERALARGPLYRYATHDERLHTIRGRILFEEQLRGSSALPLPIPVRFDEHTADIDENRVLLAAVNRVRWLTRSRNFTQRLSRLQALLEMVSRVNYTASTLPDFTFDRLNAHYQQALDLATLALRSSGVEHRQGHHSAATFLVDMNAVFENYVVTGLRRRLHVPADSWDQGGRRHPIYLDTPLGVTGSVRLRPDYAWWHAGRCRAVGDAKYKRLSPKGFEHHDIYQMLAYLTALGLPDGTLVYPSTEVEPGTVTVAATGHRVHIATLNVSGTPAQLEDSLAQLATGLSRPKSSARAS